MLQIKPQLTLPSWILGVALFACCSTGALHGEDGSGLNAGAGTSLVSTSASSQTPAPTVMNFKDARYYLQSTWSFRNFLEAGFVAGIPNITAAPIQPQAPTTLTESSASAYANAMDGYSAGMDSWRQTSEAEMRYRGRRFGVGLATAETRDLLSNFLLPMALREDPRYEPASLDLSFGNRIGWAAESVFVTRNSNGTETPNFSKWIGTAGAAVIAKHLYADRLGVPELATNRFVWRYIGYSLAGDEATNVAHEIVRTALRQDLIHTNEHGITTEDNYYPLSTAGIFVYWARSAYAPRNFIQGALIAGLPNIPSQPVYPATPGLQTKAQELAYAEAVMQYGTAMGDWRRTIDVSLRYRTWRFVGGVSESETQEFLGNCLIPLALRMDPRFLPMGPGQGIGSRMGNAFAQIGVSRTDSGSRTLNLPLLVSTVGSAFVAQQLYYPRLGTPELTTNDVVGKTIGFNLAGDLLLNIVHEFL